MEVIVLKNIFATLKIGLSIALLVLLLLTTSACGVLRELTEPARPEEPFDAAKITPKWVDPESKFAKENPLLMVVKEKYEGKSLYHHTAPNSVMNPWFAIYAGKSPLMKKDSLVVKNLDGFETEQARSAVETATTTSVEESRWIGIGIFVETDKEAMAKNSNATEDYFIYVPLHSYMASPYNSFFFVDGVLQDMTNL